MHRVIKPRDEIRVYVPTLWVASALGDSDSRVVGSLAPLGLLSLLSQPQKGFSSSFLVPGAHPDFRYFHTESLGKLFLVPSLDLDFCTRREVGCMNTFVEGTPENSSSPWDGVSSCSFLSSAMSFHTYRQPLRHGLKSRAWDLRLQGVS